MHFSPLLLRTPGLFFSPAVFVLSLPPVIAGSPLLIVIPRFFSLSSFPSFFSFSSFPGFFSFSSFPGLTGESVREMSGSRPNMTEREKRPNMTKKIQGTASRYARRKQRASTKVPAAASAAVKLATACALQQRLAPQPASAQGRPLVKLATACVIRVFSKTSESESYSKKQGENFLIVQQKYVSIYFTR